MLKNIFFDQVILPKESTNSEIIESKLEKPDGKKQKIIEEVVASGVKYK